MSGYFVLKLQQKMGAKQKADKNKSVSQLLSQSVSDKRTYRDVWGQLKKDLLKKIHS